MTKCRNCKVEISLDGPDQVGGYTWVHEFQSTVCYDDPPGSRGDVDGLGDDDLTVAETACEFPGGDCTDETRWYIMGAHAGDWAVRVCDEHRGWARRAMAPYIEYPEP